MGCIKLSLLDMMIADASNITAANINKLSSDELKHLLDTNIAIFNSRFKVAEGAINPADINFKMLNVIQKYCLPLVGETGFSGTSLQLKNAAKRILESVNPIIAQKNSEVTSIIRSLFLEGTFNDPVVRSQIDKDEIIRVQNQFRLESQAFGSFSLVEFPLQESGHVDAILKAIKTPEHFKLLLGFVDFYVGDKTHFLNMVASFFKSNNFKVLEDVQQKACLDAFTSVMMPLQVQKVKDAVKHSKHTNKVNVGQETQDLLLGGASRKPIRYTKLISLIDSDHIVDILINAKSDKKVTDLCRTLRDLNGSKNAMAMSVYAGFKDKLTGHNRMNMSLERISLIIKTLFPNSNYFFKK